MDANIKKSKSQYQMLRTRKLPFEASDLSKYLVKNLQSTINVLTDKEDDGKEENTEKIPKQSTQKQLVGLSFSKRFSKPTKEKEKDIGEQVITCK